MSKFRLAFSAPILVALAFAGSAQAHTKLVSSSPAANATVTKPGRVVLTFNEKVIASFTGATLAMTSMPGMANHQPMAIAGFTSAMSAHADDAAGTGGGHLPAQVARCGRRHPPHGRHFHFHREIA